MALSLENFELQRGVLDLRYDFAYPMWDNSGALGASISDFPMPVSVQDADPSKMSFSLGEDMTLEVELQKTVINDYQPDASLDSLGEVGDSMVPLLSRMLGVDVYDRVGARVHFFQPFRLAEAAVDQFVEADLINIPDPDGPHFEADGGIQEASYKQRFEGNRRGVTVRLQTVSRRVEASLPPHFQWSDLDRHLVSEKHGILFDIDIYTVAPVEDEQLNLAEWTDDALRIIRRDCAPFLGQI
jgi:hypothetical protein